MWPLHTRQFLHHVGSDPQGHQGSSLGKEGGTKEQRRPERGRDLQAGRRPEHNPPPRRPHLQQPCARSAWPGPSAVTKAVHPRGSTQALESQPGPHPSAAPEFPRGWVSLNPRRRDGLARWGLPPRSPENRGAALAGAHLPGRCLRSSAGGCEGGSVQEEGGGAGAAGGAPCPPPGLSLINVNVLMKIHTQVLINCRPLLGSESEARLSAGEGTGR